MVSQRVGLEGQNRTLGTLRKHLVPARPELRQVGGDAQGCGVCYSECVSPVAGDFDRKPAFPGHYVLAAPPHARAESEFCCQYFREKPNSSETFFLYFD